MKQSLKYGLITAVVYIFVLTTMSYMFLWLDTLIGEHDIRIYHSTFYLSLFAIGFVISFIAGFCYPGILSRMISNYSSEHPDVPLKRVHETCQAKLSARYFLNVALVCFLSAISMICTMDEEYSAPLICMLFVCGSLFLILRHKTFGKKE